MDELAEEGSGRVARGRTHRETAKSKGILSAVGADGDASSAASRAPTRILIRAVTPRALTNPCEPQVPHPPRLDRVPGDPPLRVAHDVDDHAASREAVLVGRLEDAEPPVAGV